MRQHLNCDHNPISASHILHREIRGEEGINKKPNKRIRRGGEREDYSLKHDIE